MPLKKYYRRKSMKFSSSWSFRPFVEPVNEKAAQLPYICRLSHKKDSFTVDFIDNGAHNASHTLWWRVRGGGDYTAVCINGDSVTVNGVETDTDYEVYVARTDTVYECSAVRLVRTGDAPGTVVNYLHPEDTAYDLSGRFLDSSSIVKLPSGRLVSCMGTHATEEHGENLSILFSSDDNGESWHYLCELFPARWARLFFDGGKLWCLCTSCTYGDLLIGCSEDEGATWGEPSILARGTCVNSRAGWHHTPMPILHHNGRIITDIQYGAWTSGYFANAVLSAKEGSDLLDRDNWAISEFWDHRDHSDIRPTISGGEKGSTDAFKYALGGIEGSAVVTPDGNVWVIHRYGDKKPLILEYDPEDPWGELKNGRLCDMPVKDSKAPIEYDSVSGRYYMLCNYAPDGRSVGRTICALMSSGDLSDWKLERIVFDYSSEDPKKIGLQYFDFLIDGNDILFVSRTAVCGAKNFHDSNHQTFHRIKDFRVADK